MPQQRRTTRRVGCIILKNTWTIATFGMTRPSRCSSCCWSTRHKIGSTRCRNVKLDHSSVWKRLSCRGTHKILCSVIRRPPICGLGTMDLRIRRRIYNGTKDGGQSNTVPGRATTRLLYHSRLTSTPPNARPAEPTRDAGRHRPQRKGCRNRDSRVHGQRQDGRRALT
jgi:hypothetical protein